MADPAPIIAVQATEPSSLPSASMTSSAIGKIEFESAMGLRHEHAKDADRSQCFYQIAARLQSLLRARRPEAPTPGYRRANVGLFDSSFSSTALRLPSCFNICE